MTNFPHLEVAISDTDRAEIEAIYIELMREHNQSAQAEANTTGTFSPDQFKDPEHP